MEREKEKRTGRFEKKQKGSSVGMMLFVFFGIKSLSGRI